MIRSRDQALVSDLGDGVTRRVLIHGGMLMAVEFRFEQGAQGLPHKHPHEQVGVFTAGKFEVSIQGEEKRTCRAGDSYYVPPDTVHGVVCLEKGSILDVFTPVREDFLS